MSDDECGDNECYFVLSIDGGGFRGFACLRILAHLIEELRSSGNDEDDPPPRPCQIFDLICGTSTGGLIAILLGRFGLSCGEAIAVYKEIGATMFDGETDSGKIWGKILGGQLSSEVFERQLEDIITRYTGSKDTLFRPTKSAADTVAHESTKTFVTVVSKIGSAGVDAYRIRSYPRPSGDIDPAPYGHKWTIFESARGTCATPLYLSPLKIQNGPHATYTFQDAGHSGFNNPSMVAIEEAEKLFHDNAKITLVSLGTGLRNLIDRTQRAGTGVTKEVKDEHVDDFAQHILANVGVLGASIRDAPEVAKRIAKQLLDVATDTEISHLHAHEWFRRQYGRDQRRYYRFNPPQGLGDIAVTDYRQEDNISSITDAWLKSPKGKADIRAAAESMKDYYQLKQAKNAQPVDILRTTGGTSKGFRDQAIMGPYFLQRDALSEHRFPGQWGVEERPGSELDPLER